MTAPHTITIARLRELGACEDQVSRLESLYGPAVTVTRDLCLEHAEWVDFDWASRHLLTPAARATYLRDTAAAQAAYERDTAPARAAYERARAGAWEAYERAKAAAFADAFLGQ